jgi:hypothetical protein
VSDSPDDQDLPVKRRAAATRSRRPRFALPAEHHDERVSERIEAFLEGPTRARRRARPASSAATARVPRRPIPLDTRPDWDAALRFEDARSARYGRPCAILVVELRDVLPPALERVAGALGSSLRHEARETDRVARISPVRFHVLLPETTEAEAQVLASRVRTAVLRQAGVSTSLTLAMRAAAPRRGETLPAALERAIADLSDEDPTPERSTA